MDLIKFMSTRMITFDDQFKHRRVWLASSQALSGYGDNSLFERG